MIMKIKHITIIVVTLLTAVALRGVDAFAQDSLASTSGIYNAVNIAPGSAHVVVEGDLLRRSSQMYLGAGLAGRVPGLFVATDNNEPGNETYSFNIRGNSTTSSNAPLLLIDGFEVSNLNYLNVKDVERVTVLKDASAIAIYGFKGANGVILVETKRGRSGKLSIDAGVNYTIQQAAVKPTMLSSAQYAELTNEANKNYYNVPFYSYSQDQIDAYRSGENPLLYPNRDWYDYFMKPSVNTVNAYFVANGGSEYVNYYTSIDYTRQDSPYRTDHDYEYTYGLNRIQMRTNLDAKINDYISAFLNVDTRISKRNSSNAGDIYASIFSMKPTTYGPTTPNGGVLVTPENLEPTYGRLNRSGYVKQNEVNTLANLGIHFDLSAITEGLSATVEGVFHNNLYSNMRGNSGYAKWTSAPNGDDLLFTEYGTSKDEPITLSKDVNSNYSTQFNANIGYHKVLDRHRVGVNAIGSYYYALNQADNFPSLYIGGSATGSYSYDETFFLDVIASTQGSYRLSPKNRFGFFPAASFAWVVSKHDFLRDNPVISSLKLRTSYGEVGYDGFASDAGNYIYKDNIDRSGGMYIQNLGGGINVFKYANRNLTWEKSRILNVGFDLELMHYITLSANYFDDRRRDILTPNDTDPIMTGIPIEARPWKNMGKVHNQGVEFTAGFQKEIDRDWLVGASGYVTYAKNKVLATGNLDYDNTYYYSNRSLGFPVGQIWGYQIDYSNGNGYFNSNDEIIQSGLTYDGTAPTPGDFKYIDYTKDGKIDVRDMVPMGGTSTPEVNYGLELSAKWKDLDFSMLFQGVTGHYYSVSSGLGYYENVQNGTFFERHLNAWTPERYAEGATITAPALKLIGGNASHRSSNYYLNDMSYFKLGNVSLGYNIPYKFYSKISSRVHLSAMNLFTIDNSNSKDMHAENSSLTQFPVYRYYQIGLNINF